MWVFRKILILFTIFLFLLNSFSFSQQIGKSWEFNEISNFEGIIIGNSFQDTVVENGLLKATVSGTFPSLSSESFELEAADYGFIQIRMKIPGATSGKVMWNNDSGDWGYTQFTTTGDSDFQEFDIPVYLSNQWVGKITKIMRLDFNPIVGSVVEIDYIRIVRIGEKPNIPKFAPLRTIFKQNSEIPLFAILKNDGDIEADLSSTLTLPVEATLVGGTTENDHGLMFKEQADTLNWIVKFNSLGEYEIRLKLFSEGDTTEKIISFNVTDEYWDPEEFLLSAWSPPYAWYGSPYEDVVFEDYKNANFNNVLWVRPEDELMGMVKKHNLKYFLLVTSVLGGDLYLRARKNEMPPDITEEMLLNLDGIIEKYKDDPNLLGYHICDEPYRQAFPNIGRVVKRIKEKDPTRLSFVNIWPSGDDYKEYIDDLLQTTKLELLSYDRYHFFNGYDGGEYFSNLSVIREYALKYDIPFCNIIQAIGTNGTIESRLNWRTPNEAEHRWLVYSSLTYGVHALVWFHWHLDWGLTGNPDREIIYPSIQKINAEIDSLSQIMLQLKTTEVYHSQTFESKWLLPSDGIIKSVSNNAEILIGYFKDKDEKDYFMLMNKDHDNTSSIQVILNGTTDHLSYFEVDSSTWIDITQFDTTGSTVFDIKLRAGGGKLFSVGSLTDANNDFSSIPNKFNLEQNYPNPFNPSTTIKYSIPNVGNENLRSVQLKIYDILGREVTTLVNKKQKSGKYEVKFDASNLTSGLYFYRITTNRFTKTMKMVLLK